MQKRDRLALTLTGEATDRPPVALWRHWPGDDQRSADFVRYTVGFQRAYDWDFIKLTPYSAYNIADFGAQTRWQGRLDGDRDLVKRPIGRSLDWTELRPLDPRRGELAKQIEAINLTADALKDEPEPPPVIMTIYSPLTQAMMMAGDDLGLAHLRKRADRLRTGLNAVTDTLLRFLEALRRTPIEGIYYVMSHASFEHLSEAEYAEFGIPYDRKILEARSDRWWLTMLRVGAQMPMFDLAATYPVPAIHWDTAAGMPTLEEARLAFDGALCGGIDNAEHLHTGTPSGIRDTVRDAISLMNGRRLIVTASDSAFATTPRSNLRAVREAVGV